jgi:hypothetical protein
MAMKEFTIKRKPFFYDAQIKRYLVQIGAMFAGYQVMSGKRADGQPRFRDIPLLYASSDRTVLHYLSGGNMNTALTVPVFSMALGGLRQKAEARRAPSYTEVKTYQERIPQATYEGNMETETDGSGGTFQTMQVERYMPVPYEMTIDLTLWASNMDEALQVTEQIGQQFNPEMDIQLSNSVLDWTYLTTISFDGDFNYVKSARDLGAGGGEDDYHIVEMSFTTTAHISPPVKVYPAELIEEIHLQMREMDNALVENDFSSQDLIEGFIIRTED